MPVAVNFFWTESVKDVVSALLSTIDSLSSSQHTPSRAEADAILRQTFRDMDLKRVRALTYEKDYEELRDLVLQTWDENP